MQYWKKKSQEEIQETIFSCLNENVDFKKSHILGVPASHLDEMVFNQDASFLKDAPFMSTLVHNPNHIGCHTLGSSESFFKGTHEIEREVIRICASDILQGGTDEFDGYVASGGTEANLQAVWIYRNFFQQVHHAQSSEIAIICSSDTHYSCAKAANVFGIDLYQVPVNLEDRAIKKDILDSVILEAQSKGKKYFIVIANMMTTMFGSVDDVNLYTKSLSEKGCIFKIHVDGAFGGFYYPFTGNHSEISFANPNISSFTLDAHKMAQAPYGTGVFVARKGLIGYANTKEASYVEGEDCTLIGSRSGANAVAIWMILSKHGPYGWDEKIYILQKRTQWMCDQLTACGVSFYRNPYSNIITMKNIGISVEIAKEFGLVPDNHKQPNWYKIVVMDHVNIEKLEALIEAFKVFV